MDVNLLHFKVFWYRFDNIFNCNTNKPKKLQEPSYSCRDMNFILSYKKKRFKRSLEDKIKKPKARNRKNLLMKIIFLFYWFCDLDLFLHIFCIFSRFVVLFLVLLLFFTFLIFLHIRYLLIFLYIFCIYI